MRRAGTLPRALYTIVVRLNDAAGHVVVCNIRSQMMGTYSVSKTALLGLCKVMAKTCAPKNIRVNAIAPGIIKTKFSEVVSLPFYPAS